MGTYTTNYNLYMPTIGEQGWGELINGNFTTIDVTMKWLNDNIGAHIGKVTAIQPTFWSPAQTFTCAMSISHQNELNLGIKERTNTYTPETAILVGWDSIENGLTSYTIDYTPYSSHYYITNMTIKFIDYFTNQTVAEQTHMLGPSVKSITIDNVPMFAKIEINSVLANLGDYSTFTSKYIITRSCGDIYIEPKGT